MRLRARLTPEETYYPRSLYRYLNDEYIDSFFSSGILFLTSYKRCRSHEDSVRKDRGEGKYDLHFQGTTQSMHLRQQSGDNSYMLCTSTASSTNLLKRFSTSSHFQIVDVQSFLFTIGRAISGVVDIHSGWVNYVPKRSAKRLFQEEEFTPDAHRLLDVVNSGNYADLERVWKEVNDGHAAKIERLTSDLSYYAKPMSYITEMEYRMIWTTSASADDGLLVVCPEAVQYCKRVDA